MLTVRDVIIATNGKLLCGNENIEILSVSNDTRTLESGALYIPIVGANFDGHRFITGAFEKGAVASLTSQEDVELGGAMILVEDTLKALGDLARYVIKRAGVPVVGVTGSVGKTSTKDMVSSVIASKYNTLKTQGNFNNNIGLPLTALKYDNEEVMVLEMGMNHLLEIDYLTKIACPNIALITNVGTAHIGNLGSRENILKAKLEITAGLQLGGTLVINKDNDMLKGWYESTDLSALPYHVKTFGLKEEADVYPENTVLHGQGSEFDYHGKHYIVPVPGEHFVLNALSAIAVGECLDIEEERMQNALAHFELTKKRMDFETLPNGATLIDGSYNANLDSMISSLAVLGQSEAKRKIAMLADMLELGDYAKELHTKAGIACNEHHVDVLVTVGAQSKWIEEGASQVPVKQHFETNGEALAYLKEELQATDCILVKGSYGMKLKEIVEGLKGMSI